MYNCFGHKNRELCFYLDREPIFSIEKDADEISEKGV
jgi:hypothetical protein